MDEAGVDADDKRCSCEKNTSRAGPSKTEICSLETRSRTSGKMYWRGEEAARPSEVASRAARSRSGWLPPGSTQRMPIAINAVPSACQSGSGHSLSARLVAVSSTAYSPSCRHVGSQGATSGGAEMP